MPLGSSVSAAGVEHPECQPKEEGCPHRARFVKSSFGGSQSRLSTPHLPTEGCQGHLWKLALGGMRAGELQETRTLCPWGADGKGAQQTVLCSLFCCPVKVYNEESALLTL